VTRVLLFVTTSIAAACLGCATAPAGSGVDDYEIYIGFFNRLRHEIVDLRLVVDEGTSVRGMAPNSETPWKITGWYLKHLPLREPSTVKSFELRNQAPMSLEAGRFVGHDVILMTAEERSEYEGHLFSEHFPTAAGILTLSRVGVNADGTQALLYYETEIPGVLGGGGQMAVFEKTGEEWTIVDTLVVWES